MADETKDLTAPPPPSPVGEALRTDMRPFRAPDFSKVRTSRDVLAEQSRIIPEMAKAEASFKEAEMAQQTMLAGEKARGLERVASDAKTRIAKTQADEATFPYPEFHPTKENAQSLGELFSMMSTVGVMLGGAGKLSSLNALNAMGGMLKGWQAGRADLFKREKETFDKEFQRIKSIRENLRKDLDDYMKLLPYDKEAAMYKAEEITRKVGSNSIIAAYMAKQQPEMALKLLDSAGKVIQHKEDRDARERQHRESQESAERRHKESLEHAERMAQIKQVSKGKAISGEKLEKLDGLNSMEKALEKLKNDFKSEYASLGVLGFGAEMSLEAKRRLGTEEGRKAVAWWSRYNQLQAPNRHALFGATLTGNELKNYQSFTSKPGDAADVIKDSLDNQINYSKDLYKSRRKAYESAGYTVEQLSPSKVDYEKTTKGAPEPAVKFLMDNPTEQNKKFFEEKYGYLPEGM